MTMTPRPLRPTVCATVETTTAAAARAMAMTVIATGRHEAVAIIDTGRARGTHATAASGSEIITGTAGMTVGTTMRVSGTAMVMVAVERMSGTEATADRATTRRIATATAAAVGATPTAGGATHDSTVKKKATTG